MCFSRLEGTPGYMAPELLITGTLLSSDKDGGFKADAWSLGCLTFFCIFGRPLHWGDRDEVLRQIYEPSSIDSTKKVRFLDSAEPESVNELTSSFVQALTEKGIKIIISVLTLIDNFYDSVFNLDFNARMSVVDSISLHS